MTIATTSGTAWRTLTARQRAVFLALASRLASAGPPSQPVTAGGRRRRSCAARCDVLVRRIARLATTGTSTDPAGSVEIALDRGYPIEWAIVPVADAIIAGDEAGLGVPADLDAQTDAYLAHLAVILPDHALTIECGDRLVRGGCGRSVWLSAATERDRPPERGRSSGRSALPQLVTQP